MNDRRFIISMHILTLMDHNQGEWLSSDFMASSMNINPVLVRKELSNLRKHGFVETKEGKNGGSMLNKPSDEIRLSDVYLSIDDQASFGKLFADPNPKCPVGRQINDRIVEINKRIENVIVKELGQKTLAEFSSEFK